MKKIDKEQIEKDISKSVIQSLDDSKLLEARKFIKSLLDYKLTTKLYNTYITGVRNALELTKDGKIYVDYRMDGTKTGRLSNASADTQEGKLGTSFHTLPREANYNIRNYVVAKDGYDFITADMKSMELRILAHLSGDSAMIKAFNDRIDLHRFSASMTFGKPMDKINSLERQIAKEVSFLTVYGGTAITLARKRGISVAKADKIINSWMSSFPGVPAYMDKVHNFIKENAYAYTIFGRRRNLDNIRSPQKWIAEGALRQGLNFTVQSAASDTLVCCIIGLHNRLKEANLDAKIVATVHDSIELVSKKEHTQKTLELLNDEMVNYPYLKKHFGITFKVPMEIEVLVGESFGSGAEVTF